MDDSVVKFCFIVLIIVSVIGFFTISTNMLNAFKDGRIILGIMSLISILSIIPTPIIAWMVRNGRGSNMLNIFEKWVVIVIILFVLVVTNAIIIRMCGVTV